MRKGEVFKMFEKDAKKGVKAGVKVTSDASGGRSNIFKKGFKKQR